MRRRHPSGAVLATALLLMVAVRPVLAHDVGCAEETPFGGHWPMFGGNVRADRHQMAERTINRDNVTLLEPEWTFDADRATRSSGNEVTGYPVESDGCVYVGSSTGDRADGSHKDGWVFSLNAATGEVVWQTAVPGGVYSTLAVADGVVYAFVSRVSSPRVLALDQRTGRLLWQTVVDTQPGSDAVSSPIVHDGLLWVGVSGTAAEGDEGDRFSFQGSSVLIATKSLHARAADGRWRRYRTGQIVRKAWSIPPTEWGRGFAGGAQWGTIAIDPETHHGYVGTGNPFDYEHEHRNTNAVLKIDLDRRRKTFGQIVASYKGDVEAYVQQGSNVVPCDQVDAVQQGFAAGLECVRLDLDFGSTPNILRQADGRKVVVVGQKSGVVHVLDAGTLAPVQKVRLGVPSPVGGMVGSGATDGTSVFGTHTLGGYLYSLTGTGTPRWVAPVADGVHWGPPVTLANGVDTRSTSKVSSTRTTARPGSPCCIGRSLWAATSQRYSGLRSPGAVSPSPRTACWSLSGWG